jgi:hypothetical protein
LLKSSAPDVIAGRWQGLKVRRQRRGDAARLSAPTASPTIIVKNG